MAELAQKQKWEGEPARVVDSPPGKPVEKESGSLPTPPRSSRWIVREDVVWSHDNIDLGSAFFQASTNKHPNILTVGISRDEEPHRFDYARGFWFPEGKKIIDPRIDRVLPRQMEPLDFDKYNILVDPKHILYARGDLNEPASFKNKFTFISEIHTPEANINTVEVPRPLDPEAMYEPGEAPEEQVFNPNDPSTRHIKFKQ